MTAEPVTGRVLPAEHLQAIHDYLMTRPCNETLELVLAIRSSEPISREPSENPDH